MNESDEFRQQVDELKQRLGATQAQQESQADALTRRLTSVKATLQQKHQEISRLTDENQQLRVMLDEVIALLNRREDLASGQMIDGFLNEISQFVDGEETDTLQQITISAPPAPSAWQRDEQPTATAEPEAMSGLPVEPPAAAEIKAEETATSETGTVLQRSIQQPEPMSTMSPPEQKQDQEPEADQDKEQDEEQEELPALKRILKRGQRGR